MYWLFDIVDNCELLDHKPACDAAERLVSVLIKNEELSENLPDIDRKHGQYVIA
jgi:hypothetical protein